METRPDAVLPHDPSPPHTAEESHAGQGARPATAEQPPPTQRPARRPRTTAPRRHSRRIQGLAYAAPTAVFVIVFFLLPLLLVGQMSLDDWPLLAGDQGANAPRELHRRHGQPAVLARRPLHPPLHGGR
ncbi:hypothetical protein QA942_40450, partial [Streptomyces sp. B21-106]